MSLEREGLAKSVQVRLVRHADLLGFGDLCDDNLMKILRDVCVVEVEPDGVTFDADSVTIAPIREEDAYGGRRVTLRGHLGVARLTIQVDIGIGDAVTPEPQVLDYPSLLGLPRPRLRAYPRETVVAEKLHAMVLLGLRNSRMKDYFDIRALLREGQLDERLLGRAIAATFERRRTAVPDGVPAGLTAAFSDDTQHQARWKAFLDKNRLKGPELAEVVGELCEGLASALDLARKRKVDA